MTEAQKRLVELDRKKAEIKKFFEEYEAAKEAVRQELGLDKYWQDEEGIVYKLTKPTGRFVQYEETALERTRRKGERAGTISLKEAKEAGFEVEVKE